MENTRVNVGQVACFDEVALDKAQALKVLEEAAEVVEAFKKLDALDDWPGGDSYEAYSDDLLSECADVIQATCNLACAAMEAANRHLRDEDGAKHGDRFYLWTEGFGGRVRWEGWDMQPAMAACERRNRKRGRITGGGSE